MQCYMPYTMTTIFSLHKNQRLRAGSSHVQTFAPILPTQCLAVSSRSKQQQQQRRRRVQFEGAQLAAFEGMSLSKSTWQCKVLEVDSARLVFLAMLQRPKKEDSGNWTRLAVFWQNANSSMALQEYNISCICTQRPKSFSITLIGQTQGLR